MVALLARRAVYLSTEDVGVPIVKQVIQLRARAVAIRFPAPWHREAQLRNPVAE